MSTAQTSGKSSAANAGPAAGTPRSPGPADDSSGGGMPPDGAAMLRSLMASRGAHTGQSGADQAPGGFSVDPGMLQMLMTAAREQSGGGDTSSPDMGVTQAVMAAARNKGAVPTDVFQEQAHYVSSCGGRDGTFVVLSSFVFQMGFGCVTSLTISLRDCDPQGGGGPGFVGAPICLPTTDVAVVPRMFADIRGGLEAGTLSSGARLVPASYNLCAELVFACVGRVKGAGRTLTAEQRQTIALYSLHPAAAPSAAGAVTPLPAPAPSVDCLWLVLSRPEYFGWGFSSANKAVVGALKRIGQTAGAQRGREAAAVLFGKDRDLHTLRAMLRHMAVWHALGGDDRAVSAWLLWEAERLGDDPAAIPGLASAQIIAEKAFDDTAAAAAAAGGHLGLPQSRHHKTADHGRAVLGYMAYAAWYRKHARLPDTYAVDGRVAAGGTTVGAAEPAPGLGSGKALCARSCHACGFTGGKLLACGKCGGAAYCGRDHQVLHWKHGHKSECGGGGGGES